MKNISPVFASYVVEAYAATYPETDPYDAVRPGARLVVREMAQRCLSEPSALVSLAEALAMDQPLWTDDPTAGPFGERLAAEGEICWGGMHSWKRNVELLEMVNRPKTLGFQADMAHTLLFTLGYNAPEDRILPEGYDWKDAGELDAALKTMTRALRPWTIDFHVAQNDATVFGSGTHDHTGRHCLANDPNGKLDIAHHAGFWLKDRDGRPTKAVQHVCWDGCMFPNAVMSDPSTWNNILAAMIRVRDAHGWNG